MSTDLNEWVDPNKTKAILSIEEAKARILKKEVKPPTSFPIEVFPDEIQSVLRELKESKNYNTDFTSAGVMSTVASAIGSDIEIFNGQWKTPAILWNCVVGNRGTNKTHPLSWTVSPIDKLDKEIHAKYALDYDEHIFNESTGPVPKLKNRVFKDFTLETIAANLEHNEKGLMVFNDELNGWISKMNAPNSAGAEDNWLEAFNGNSITVNRIKDGRTLRVDKPIVNVLGGIQPDRLINVSSGGRFENGFFDRMLFYYPDNLEPLTWNTTQTKGDPSGDYYASVVNSIEARSQALLTVPKNYIEDIYKPWYDSNNKKYFYDPSSAGLQSKLVTYYWRLVLVLEVLKQEVSKQHSDIVSEESMLGALKLVEYFRGTANKVLDFISDWPEDKLPTDKRTLFFELPENEVFTAGEADVIGDSLNMSRRAVNRFLKDTKLFTKVSRGKYLRGANRKKA